MLQQTDELNRVDPNTAEIALIPDYDYSAADFATPVPYEKLYELHSAPFVYEMAKVKMEINAKAVGFKSFKSMLQKYIKAQLDAKRRSLIPNQTEFEDQVSMMDMTAQNVRMALEALNVETMTPIEAMNELYKLKLMLK